MDEMIQAPQTSENPQQFDLPPIGEPPKERGTIRKIFDKASWYIFFAFLPATVLILLSQNTIPGDLFYPIKRGMEGVVLAAASVSPATRAAFRTDLTTRRFDEAEKLLLASSDIKGLKDFVTEIQVAQTEVSAISNPVKKQELQQKIQTSVMEYEKRLIEVKAQLTTREQATQLAFAPTLSPTKQAESQQQKAQTVSPEQIEPTVRRLPTNTPVPIPTSKVGQLPIPTNTPVPPPTSTPKPPIPSKPPTATPTPIPPTNASTQAQIKAPTVTPIPSFTPIPTLIPQPSRDGETIEMVDRVQEFLHCLKKTPPPHRECVPPEINSASPKEENQLDRRNEERLKREEKLEERKKVLEEKRNEEEKKRKERNESERKDTSNDQNSNLENTH